MSKLKVIGIDHGRYYDRYNDEDRGIWDLPQDVIDSHAILIFAAIPYYQITDLKNRLFYQKVKHNFDVLQDFSNTRKDVKLIHMEDINIPNRFFEKDFHTTDFDYIAKNCLTDDYYLKTTGYYGPTLEKMKEAYEFIQNNKNKDILVSCSAGVVRTGAMVDYLTSTGWELDQTTPGAHKKFHANKTMIKLLQMIDKNYTSRLIHERKPLV